jgi:cyclopropane-fatty-acyl-phospholipid synthase
MTTTSKRSDGASGPAAVPSQKSGSLPAEPAPIDASRWPDVAAVPDDPLRAAVAKRLFTGVVHRLAMQVALPDGGVLGGGRAGDPVMKLVRPDAFYRRLGAGGLIGFGEAYMAGDWDADDLTGLLTVFAHDMATLIPPRLQRLRDLAVQHQPRLHRATTTASKRNIAHHYDLSNDLFAQFLDPSMTYSSALFEERPGENRVPPVATRELLQEAQHRKIDRLLDGAHVGPGTTVLEIGTGWGELALRAARRGAAVTSITLSEQQRELALRRVADAGVADRVDIQLCDYRNATGTYDAVLSVEMIEAVGYEFWPIYFRTLDERLRPGGRVGLQAITMQHDRMWAARDTYTWILKYIFPGGLIPSVEAIEATVASDTRLTVLDRRAFGLHYAQTLGLWREKFEADSGAVEELGFDATFRRMWSLYLAYSEAGFRSGYLDVYQYVFTK